VYSLAVSAREVGSGLGVYIVINTKFIQAQSTAVQRAQSVLKALRQDKQKFKVSKPAFYLQTGISLANVT
jgi:hypothetical protein